jgi:tetratricopeptide (TPR) repeat protein
MYPQVLGIYRRKRGEGHQGGASGKRSESTTHWFVRRLSEEDFEVQPLNFSYVPSGIRTILSKGQLLAEYVPEPNFYESHTLPALKSLQKKIELGEQFFRKGLLSKAEKEFLKAIMIDEESPEANLGLGAVYAEQGEFQKVKKVLKVLLGSDAAFQEEQRKRFNTFGISLRKRKLYDEAAAYYGKALEFNDNDENLHFNLARALYEKGDEIGCMEQLEACLRLRSDFTEARKFLDYIGKH